MTNDDIDFGAPCNVVAAFRDEHQAAVALDVLAARGVPRSTITVHHPGEAADNEEIAELRAEMQDEVTDSWGLFTGRQARRAAVGAGLLGGIGLAAGLAAGSGWAYLFSSGLSPLARIGTSAGVGGLAGLTIGSLNGGLAGKAGDESGGSDPPLAAERDILVAVRFQDPILAERALALLRGLGADYVHRIDAHGVALPAQAEHPRPADPENWWWGRAGYG